MLTQCRSCPCKATNPPFPPTTISVGGSNKAPRPGTWSGATHSCHFQRAEGCHQPWASPLVTKQLGTWHGTVTPLPPHVLTGTSTNAESRNAFSSGINATFATHTRQPLLAGKNKLFSSPSEGFSLPSNYPIFSNVFLFLMTPGSQSSHLEWSVHANTPTGSLALKNSVPFQQLPPGYLCTIHC